MNTDYTEGEDRGTKALMLTLLAGAALLFVEVTWSPAVQTVPVKHPVAQTVHVDRVARN